ncbi:unnamed protein product [Linum tenue]|uniref:G3BP-like protein n=1 Tax=Linum tenue TaxID=586396 RepID=A0AAV0HDG8_9ROSI|nr:unnamed protein product [Linum tenue]
MASPYAIPVTAAQVGTYFVGQYYQVLQSHPALIHQFYSDSSSMLRVDGVTRESGSTMLDIHSLIMRLNYTAIEIKTAHALESWSGGVLVMVSGLLQSKNFGGTRKFVETFFLAPQEKGYFVLNDVFHFIEEEPIHLYPAVLAAQRNLDSKLNNAPPPTGVPEPVSKYLLGGEIQSRESVSPSDEAHGNGQVDNYAFPQQQFQHVLEPEHIAEQVEVSNGSLQNAATDAATQDHLPSTLEEPAEEPQKHTYASILRIAKGQPPASSERNHSSPATDQKATVTATLTSNSFDNYGVDNVDEAQGIEDEDEIRSVYVRNLPPIASEEEIEEEFTKFGKIAPEGVVIRSRKDVGVCYAFVEFEDMSGVHKAVKAGSAEVAGRQVYIEERRPNSNIPPRFGRGRGRGSYQADAPRGRFGSRGFGRGGGSYGGDYYNRPTRGNGYYRPIQRQDRAQNESSSDYTA